MIDYRCDLTKPYLIVDMDETHVVVTGTSKVLQTTDGEFGGIPGGSWRVPKWRLLSKDQKKAIKWMRSNLGDRAADKERDRLCAVAIVKHTNSTIS